MQTQGYTVVEAQHGGEALLICERYAKKIHLLVTDVVMPHLSGRKLAERLATLQPMLKVLYMSGYTDDAIVRHGVLGAGMAFLSKPFTPDALALKIDEILGTPPRTVDPVAAPLAGQAANGNGVASGPVVQRAEDVGTTRPSRV